MPGDENDLSRINNARQAGCNISRIGCIFFIPLDNLSPHNYCAYVPVLMMFRHVNVFSRTEAEQMRGSTNCFPPSSLLMNTYALHLVEQHSRSHLFSWDHQPRWRNIGKGNRWCMFVACRSFTTTKKSIWNSSQGLELVCPKDSGILFLYDLQKSWTMTTMLFL